jgi:hypothetical protein
VAIKAIFDAFEARLKTVLGDLGERQPTIKLSSNALSDQNSAPRIVMVPATGTISNSLGSGGGGERISNPRSLKARFLRFELHIWGKDFDEAEALMSHAAAALHDLAFGVDNAVSEDWTRGQASTAKSGVLVVMAIVIEIPLVRETEITARITNFPIASVEIVSQLV